MALNLIKESKEQVKLDQQNNNKIEEYFNEPEIQEFFLKNQRVLKAIFKIYVQRDFTPLNINGQRTTMSLNSFLGLAHDFQIVKPKLANHNQLFQIYNTIIRQKPKEDNIQEGLDFKEFLHSLIRICIKVDEVMPRDQNLMAFLKEDKSNTKTSKFVQNQSENQE